MVKELFHPDQRSYLPYLIYVLSDPIHFYMNT